MFHGGPALTVVALVRWPFPYSPLSFLNSKAFPDWLIENAWPDRHDIGCDSHR
jgi:hypothetical protein